MDVDSILGKLESKADKLGAVVGVYGLAAQMSPGDPFAHIYNTIRGIIQTPHMPNITHMLNSLLSSDVAEGAAFRASLMAAAAGWLLESVDIDTKVTRIGSFLKNAGTGAAAAVALYTLLEFCGQFNSRGTARGGGSSLESQPSGYGY